MENSYGYPPPTICENSAASYASVRPLPGRPQSHDLDRCPGSSATASPADPAISSSALLGQDADDYDAAIATMTAEFGLSSFEAQMILNQQFKLLVEIKP
jgi:hypothetical protein